MGDISVEAYLSTLKNSLGSYTKYSDEWMSISRTIQSVEDEIAAEAKAAAEEKARIEEESMRHTQMIQDNMYRVGAMGTNEYLSVLQTRLAGLERYSDEWASVWQEIQSINDEARAHDKMIQDNMFRVGDMSTDAYLSILNTRLAGLEKYSDEWASVWQEIQDITANAQADIEATARQIADHTDSIFSALADSFDAVTAPLYQATNLMSNLGGDEASQDSIAGYYAHMSEALEKWAKTVEGLRAAGLNNKTLNDIIAAGPSSLPFAQSILNGGLVDTINAGEAAIASSIGSFGKVNMDSSSISGTTVNVGGVQITIGEGSTLTMAEVQKALDDAMIKLSQYIETGVSN
jgi:predicted  nucleic acid-binding Zn-ribbon protein